MSLQPPPWRLPRVDALQAREPELLALLGASARPLWEQAKLAIPELALTDALEAALRAAAAEGQLARGLETAERVLDGEQRGLALVDAKTPEARGVRISRLIVLSDDGAPRFYRNVETLLLRHEGRVLALRVAASAERLGALLFGPGETARLALLTHKEAVAHALLALLPGPA